MTFRKWYESLTDQERLRIESGHCKELVCEAYGKGWNEGVFGMIDGDHDGSIMALAEAMGVSQETKK